jgi:molybdopterin-biosynthesis enzyme MoeA-like protein
MNEDFPILPAFVGACIALVLGYEINRRRNKLRRVFNTFDRQESNIADALEQMVESGQLKPYVPNQTA